MADSLLANRRFPEALIAYTRLLGCLDSSGPPDSLSARFHRDYGWALARGDSTEEAGKYLSRALTDWAAVAGDSSAGYDITLERYARWNLSTGNFEAAHRDFLKSWQILVKTLGPDDRETLWAEHGLAQTLDHFKRRAEALQHIAHVYEVRKRVLSPQDLDLAWTSNDYAVILHGMGRLPEAEDLYRQAYEARRNRLPHLFCQTGWGYAVCLAAEGDFRDALKVITEVSETIERHPDLEKALAAGTTVTAAEITSRLGDLPGTKRLEERFRQVAKRYGADERTRNRNYSIQAYILEREGHFQAGVDTLRASLKYFTGIYGANSPLTVPTLARLARLDVRLGRTNRADSLFQKGLANADPSKEPALFGSLAADYVRFLSARGRLPEAERWAAQALSSVKALPRDHIVRSKVDETAGELRSAQGHPRAAWELAYDAASASLHRYQLNLQAMTSEQISAYWKEEVSSLDLLLSLLSDDACKGSRFVEAAWTLAIGSRGSLLDELTRRRELGAEPDTLRTLKRHLANLLTMDPVEGLAPVSPKLLQRLDGEIARFEERLAASRPITPTRPTLDTQALRKGLPPETTLIAYVQYGKGNAPHYGAFLMEPEKDVRFQDLGAASRIDTLVTSQQTLMEQAPEELILDPDGAEAAYRSLGAALRHLLLDPIFGGNLPKDLVLIPTGPLWNVNVLALPRGRTSYLVEELGSFRLAESERELISPASEATGKGLLAVGGVDYSAWGSGAPAELPASLDEAEQVVTLWKKRRPGEPVTLLTGTSARESVLPRRIPGSRVVHLAAHGVDWTDPLTGEPCAGLRLVRPLADSSGFDGVWGEREIALEDFSSVELVFLSSCRSSEGTALPGERVAGLYRAFRLAGAHSAILSIWDIGDHPSRDWCLRFYDHFLDRDGSASVAAFYTSSETLQIRRSTGRPTHPYYWACFLAVGD